jgi:hypothetical protein
MVNGSSWDLGVELPAHEVPLVLIRKAKMAVFQLLCYPNDGDHD